MKKYFFSPSTGPWWIILFKRIQIFWPLKKYLFKKRMSVGPLLLYSYKIHMSLSLENIPLKTPRVLQKTFLWRIYISDPWKNSFKKSVPLKKYFLKNPHPLVHKKIFLKKWAIVILEKIFLWKTYILEKIPFKNLHPWVFEKIP